MGVLGQLLLGQARLRRASRESREPERNQRCRRPGLSTDSSCLLRPGHAVNCGWMRDVGARFTAPSSALPAPRIATSSARTHCSQGAAVPPRVSWMAWAIRNRVVAHAALKAIRPRARNAHRAPRDELAPIPATQAAPGLVHFALPVELETAPSPTWRQETGQVVRLWGRTTGVPAP